jgi:hypothetical protein
MSTITRRILRFVGRAAAVLACWAIFLLVMPFVGPSGRDVAVIGDREHAIRAIAAAGGQIVSLRGRVTLARSSHAGFAAALYRRGAPLVLEGRIGAGCAAVLR